jgi:hypothetical protein
VTEQEDTMVSSTRTTTVRRLGRITTVGALALLLAGVLASPAEAMRRSEAFSLAQQLVNICASAGADTWVESGSTGNGGGYAVLCTWPDGQTDYAWYDWDFEPSPSENDYRNEHH